MKKQNTSQKKRLTARAFAALSAKEKERIYREIDSQKPGQVWAESTRPNAAQKTRLGRIAKKMGRPKIGRGVRIVSVSVERSLLDRADAYAKRHGLKRAEFFNAALQGALSASNDK